MALEDFTTVTGPNGSNSGIKTLNHHMGIQCCKNTQSILQPLLCHCDVVANITQILLRCIWISALKSNSLAHPFCQPTIEGSFNRSLFLSGFHNQSASIQLSKGWELQLQLLQAALKNPVRRPGIKRKKKWCCQRD